MRGKVLKKGVSLVIAFMMLFSSMPAVAAEKKVEAPNAWKGINFMPPDPSVYPEYYKKGNGSTVQLKQMTENRAPRLKSAAKFSSALPTAGSTEKVLVIPIQFTDVRFSTDHNQAYFQSMMTGSKKSLKNYYEMNSSYVANTRGMSVDATVSSVVTSDHTMAYYGADRITGSTNEIDELNGDVSEITREAVKKLDALGFDFAPYDKNGDGVIDHIFLIHAGSGQENTPDPQNTLIWSHRSNITSGELVDGKMAWNYAMVPETGRMGVFCHEFGHDISLPDLYDADGDQNGITEGVGDWDVMGSGSWNAMPGEINGDCPANLSAWSKSYLGWVIPSDITSNSANVTIQNVDGNSQVLCLWPGGNKSSQEYFLAEYRRKMNYDAGLPGEGVLVWHIDSGKLTPTDFSQNTVNCNEYRLGVELEQADGNWNLWTMLNRGDGGDPFPGSSKNRNFSVLPYGKRIYSGTTIYGFGYSNVTPGLFTNVDINNISVAGKTAFMDCKVANGAPTEAPSLKAPVNLGKDGLHPYFSWTCVGESIKYQIQIADDNAFTTNLKTYNVENPNEIYYDGKQMTYVVPETETPLILGKTYYWRISGANSSGAGPWSEVRMMKASGGSGDNSLGNMISTVVTIPDAAYSLSGLVQYNSNFYCLAQTNDQGKKAIYRVDPDNGTSEVLTQVPITPGKLYDNQSLTLVGDEFFIIGGMEKTTGEWITTADCFKYSFVTNSWTQISSMTVPRRDIEPVVVGNEIYMFGGDQDTTITNSVEKYNTELGQWSTLQPVSGLTECPRITYQNGLVYLVKPISEPNKLSVYNIATQSWDTITCSLGNVLQTTQTMCADGTKVYFTIVDPTSEFKRTVVSYNTHDGTWRYEDVHLGSGSVYFLGKSITYDLQKNRLLVFGSDVVKFCIYNIELNGNIGKPANVQMFASEDAVRVNWTNPSSGTATTISVDGEEFSISGMSSYIQSALSPNSTHQYRLRSENDNLMSDWTETIYATTLGAPIITVDASASVEGAENGKVILLNVTNGNFRADGCYNRATVSINPADLPSGVTEGDVTYVSPTQLSISLVGNRTADYDVDKQLRITVAKEEITTAADVDIEATGALAATVEAGPAAPSIVFNFSGPNANRLMGATTDMEYSVDGGSFYISVPSADPMINTLLINSTNDIRVRVKSTGYASAGTDQIIDIQPGPAAPSVTGDDTLNTVTGMTTDMEFSTDGGSTWATFNNNLPNLTGNVTFMVRLKGLNLTAPSSALSLAFTTPTPAAPAVTFSFSGTDAGKLMGATTAMEYSINGGTTYITITSPNPTVPISSISAINDIRIRVRATSTTVVGNITLLDILPGSQTIPGVTGNDSTDTLTGMTTDMEYSMNGGSTWTPFTNVSSLPNLTGSATITIRVKGIGLTMPGVTKVISFTAPAPVAMAGGGGGGGAATPAGSFPTIPDVTSLTIITPGTALKVSDAVEGMKNTLLTDEGVSSAKSAEYVSKAAATLKDLAIIYSKIQDNASKEYLVKQTSAMLKAMATATEKNQDIAAKQKSIEGLTAAFVNAETLIKAVQADAQQKLLNEQLVNVLKTTNKALIETGTENAVKAAEKLVIGSRNTLNAVRDGSLQEEMQTQLLTIAQTVVEKAGEQRVEGVMSNGAWSVKLTGDNGVALNNKIDALIAEKKVLESSLNASGTLNSTLRIQVSALNATNIQTEVPTSTFGKMKENGVSGMSISTDLAAVSLPVDAVNTNGMTSLTLSVKKLNPAKDLTAAQKTAVGNNPVFDFGLSGTGKKGKTTNIGNFNGAVEITVPYTLTDGQDPSKLTVYFLSDKGALENKAGVYNAETKMITFKTTHFSKYFIKENKVVYSDLKGYEDSKFFIEAVSAKGILTPSKGDKFNPSGAVTKGELAKILVTAFGGKQSSDKAGNGKLKDIKKTDPNYRIYATAVELGLLSCDKNGVFKPETKVTREEFAVIIAKCAQKAKGWSVTKEEVNNLAYTDKKSIKAFAVDSVAILTKYGVMLAKKGNDYKPEDLLERAEAAKVLYQIMFVK